MSTAWCSKSLITCAMSTDPWGHPLPAFNGTNVRELVTLATFVLDPAGTIRMATAIPDYRRHVDTRDVVNAVRSIVGDLKR